MEELKQQTYVVPDSVVKTGKRGQSQHALQRLAGLWIDGRVRDAHLGLHLPEQPQRSRIAGRPAGHETRERAREGWVRGGGGGITKK